MFPHAKQIVKVCSERCTLDDLMISHIPDVAKELRHIAHITPTRALTILDIQTNDNRAILP